MTPNQFEKTSFAWQLQQWQQQLWEWIELKISQNQLNLPRVGLSSRLIKLLWPFFKVLSWLILGLVVIWLGWQLWLIFRPYIYSLGFELDNSSNKSTPHSEMTVGDWWRRSQQSYRQGNYTEATRCLYMAMLQKLHDTRSIPHQSSRTDGEYRQLTESLPHQRAYQVLLNTHEHLCFGNTDISLETFEDCQQAYQEIERDQ